MLLAVENQHARVNAMTISQRVTLPPARQHILETLKSTWGSPDITAVLDDGDWVEATLAPELNDVTWRQWSHDWERCGR